MVKPSLSVVGLLAAETEIDMLKSPENPNKKVIPRVAVIKNGHTDAELDEMAERWVNHQGSRSTLAEVVAVEKTKQQRKPENES